MNSSAAREAENYGLREDLPDDYADALARALQEKGFATERQEVGDGRFNVLARAGRPEVVFCTHLPCVMCAKRLINLGNVRVVYFDEMYREQDAIDMLLASAVQVVRYVPGKVVAITL